VKGAARALRRSFRSRLPLGPALLRDPCAPARGDVKPALLLPPDEALTADHARKGAMRRLRSPECQRLLTDFTDAGGRALAERLAEFAMPPDEYLAQITFLDGTGHRSCDNGAQLFTFPRAGRVYVCKRFLQTVWRQRIEAEVYLIHEVLHTLGLGENPPTSLEITRRVERRCVR